jgi:1-acyl-sn-glycerol-3-phosphate acyltransferase
MKKNNLARKSFYWLLRHTVGPAIRMYYRIQYDKTAIRHLKPPYMVLANHTTLWDCIYIALMIPHIVFYIASDQNFRLPFVRVLFHILGVIPKKKSVSDMYAVKQLIRIKQEKGVIGIFPEGRRTWDGRSTEILYATSKLAKNLGIPVVTIKVAGGYLSRPRWASNSRRGRIEMTARVLYTPERLAELSVDEVHEGLAAALRHDETAWQEERGYAFKGRRMAEKLELALFICPQCHRIGTMGSSGDAFTCASCGYDVRFGHLGFFEKGKDRPIHTNLPQWNGWQQARLRTYIGETGDGLLFEDAGMEKLSAGTGTGTMESHGTGVLRFYRDRIVYTQGDGEESYPLEKLRGVNVQANYKLEFYFDRILYQFRHPNRGASAYKWVSAIKACLE